MQVTWKPTIVAFCCNWCSYAGADLSGTNRLQYPANVKIIRIPCSCRLNPMFILRAFQKGADGVILCGYGIMENGRAAICVTAHAWTGDYCIADHLALYGTYCGT